MAQHPLKISASERPPEERIAQQRPIKECAIAPTVDAVLAAVGDDSFTVRFRKEDATERVIIGHARVGQDSGTAVQVWEYAIEDHRGFRPDRVNEIIVCDTRYVISPFA